MKSSDHLLQAKYILDKENHKDGICWEKAIESIEEALEEIGEL